MPAEDTLRPSEVSDMWGIDPDEIYYWTPNSCRVIIQQGKWDVKASEWEVPFIYGLPLEGAPVIEVKAMPEKIAMRLANARTRYAVAQSRMMSKAAANKRADVNSMVDTLLDQIDLIYTPELISDVLKASIVGWSNVRSPTKELKFEGDWSRDARKLRQQWQAELFKVILDETLYKGQEASFTSAPDSSVDSSNVGQTKKAPISHLPGKE